MIVQVLGCSGSIAAGSKTTSFLLDDDVLIDAGTGVGDLSLEAMAKIEHILISHSHLDHMLSIGLLADSVMRVRRAEARGPIWVHALPETLGSAAHAHLQRRDLARFHAPAERQHRCSRSSRSRSARRCSSRRQEIEVLPASHTVPAVGFAIDGGDAAGGSTPAIPARTRAVAAAAEHEGGALGDRDRVQRRRAPGANQPAPVPGCPGPGAEHLRGSVDVHITHIKPGEMETVMRDRRAGDALIASARFRPGQRIELSVDHICGVERRAR